MSNIYKKINLIMKDVSFIAKKEKGKGMLFDFVSHDDVTLLVRKPMAEHGVVVIPNVIEYVINDNKHSIKLEVTFINCDEPEDRFKVVTHGYSLDNQDKGYGKAISYALKYLYLKMFLLQSGEADEVDAYQGDTEVPISEQQVSVLEDLLSKTPKSKVAFMTWIKADSLKEIKVSMFEKACKVLESKVQQGV